MDKETLGEYRRLTAVLFGEASPAVWFLDDKIKYSREDDLVIANESQMLYLLISIHLSSNENTA